LLFSCSSPSPSSFSSVLLYTLLLPPLGPFGWYDQLDNGVSEFRAATHCFFPLDTTLLLQQQASIKRLESKNLQSQPPTLRVGPIWFSKPYKTPPWLLHSSLIHQSTSPIEFHRVSDSHFAFSFHKWQPATFCRAQFQPRLAKWLFFKLYR
jgi:hypothetical protein